MSAKIQIQLKTPHEAGVGKLPIKLKSTSQVIPITQIESKSGLIDLKLYQITKYSKVVKKVPPKEVIIEVLGQLVEHTQTIINESVGEERTKHQYRSAQFQKAIETIREYEGEITSGLQAQQLKGIGKGIADRIDEIIKTGTLKELKVTAPIDSKTAVLTELTTVTGIGDANAKKFYDAGIRSVEELKQRFQAGQIKLTHHMQIGLKYYEDFGMKIPFKEIAELGQTLKNCVTSISNDLVVEICGSHRRKKEFSGDLDVLITHTQIKTEEDVMQCKEFYLKKIVAHLHEAKFLVDDLTSQGNSKFMGVCRHPEVNKGRRIDIRFVHYEAFYPALLYFTGSMTLNKLMRNVAIDKGYTLNEYGLYHGVAGHKGSKVITLSEQAIFDHLGIIYLEPTEREF
jgi:DNA polymerase beta